MTSYGKLSADAFTDWLLEAEFIQYLCQMSIYYKYTQYGEKIVVLSYIYDFVYWYTSEALVKWFVDALGKRFHVKSLGYTHWFMPIIISQMKYHFISVDQARYTTSILAKYLDNATVKISTKVYKTTLPSDMIFTCCTMALNFWSYTDCINLHAEIG